MAAPCHDRRMRRWLSPLLLLALAGWEPFRSPNPDVEAGNQALADGNADKALEAYDRAAKDKNVDAAGLAYDRGTAELAKAQAAKDASEKNRLVETPHLAIKYRPTDWPNATDPVPKAIKR